MSTSKTGSRKSKKKSQGKAKGLQGRRFTKAQKRHALKHVVSGMSREDVARAVGTTVESVRRWVGEAEAAGTMPQLPKSETRSESPEAPSRDESAEGSKDEGARKPASAESQEEAQGS
jgi:hypothetical protein